MGLSQSAPVYDFFSELLNEEPINTLISQEIQTLTYEEFVKLLRELNILSKNCVDSNGKRLVFAIKKGTDNNVFWKATVQIAAVKVDANTQKVETYRLLSLAEFLKVFKSLKLQISVAEQSKTKDLTVSTLLTNLDKGDVELCCICLERKNEIILPCAHSYCKKCIEEWNETNDTCPICRERLESSDDTWIISEVPNAEEISKEIQESLMELTQTH